MADDDKNNNQVDFNNLSPEQQKLVDFGFAKSKTSLEKLKADHEEAMNQLAKLEKAGQLTQKERADLQAKLEEYETRNLTEKQKAEREREKLVKDYEEKLKAATTAAEGFKSRFIDNLVETELVSIASKENVFSAKQVVGLLRGSVVVEEVTDKDGKGTGKYSTKLKRFDDKGQEDVVTLEEGVKAFLKENPNLVKSSVINNRSGNLDGVIITDKQGGKQTLDIEAIRRNPNLVNENFDAVVDGLRQR